MLRKSSFTVILVDNFIYENFVDELAKIYDDILLKEAQTVGFAKTVVVRLRRCPRVPTGYP